MATKIQVRRGTGAAWTTSNTVLDIGEFGYNTSTGQLKIGDGTTAWADLDYLPTETSLGTSLGDYIELIEKGAANGVAELDGSKNVIVPGSSVIIEGATNNAYQLTVTAVDPTADRTIYLPNSDGTVVLADTSGNVIVTGNLTVSGTTTTIDSTTINIVDKFVFEGTANDFETTLTITDPTADRTITLPNSSGTVALTSDLSSFATTSYVTNAVSSHAATTTSVHGITDTAALATTSYVGTAIAAFATTSYVTNSVSSHAATTTNVHGISDTTALATTSYVTNSVSSHNATTTNVHGIADTAALATTSYVGTAIASFATTSYVTNAVSSHNATTTNVHGISDTAALATTSYVGNAIASFATTSYVGNAIASFATTSYVTNSVSSHAATTATHGVTGAIVGTTDSQTLTNKTLGSGTTLSANLAAGSNKITGLATPTADADAATKAYVDSATAGLNVHENVVAATVSNVNINNALENGDVIDGVTLATGNRVLVKNQNTAADNGIYIVQNNGAAVRATDYDAAGEVDAGDFIFVQSGTVNGKTGWVQTNTITTVGTDAIAFTQFSGAGTYSAGTGLTLTGTTFSINTATTVDLSTAQTLSNKSIALGSNTLTGTLAQFNTAVTDADFASLAGSETLTNKTINGANNTLTVRLANDISGFGTGVATFLATPSSANLASAITDETGSGSLVFGTSPSFTTSITTASTSFNLLNTTATTINFAGAATALTIGATSGTTTVQNDMNLSSGKRYKINNTNISAALPALTWADVKNGKSGLTIS